MPKWSPFGQYSPCSCAGARVRCRRCDADPSLMAYGHERRPDKLCQDPDAPGAPHNIKFGDCKPEPGDCKKYEMQDEYEGEPEED